MKQTNFLKKQVLQCLTILLVLAMLLPYLSGLRQPARVSASGVQLYGVDISSHNGTIDWPMLAANDVDFVIMRGGIRPSESRAYYKDAQFERNYAGARSVGMKIGVYLYCAATTWASFEESVYDFLDSIEGKEFDYPVYLDLESTAQTKLGKAKLTQFALDGLAILREAGYEAGVYANLNWYKNYLDGEAIKEEGYHLWIAHYVSNPSAYNYSRNYGIWQYSSTGNLAGNGGTAIDQNVSYIDYNFLPDLYPEKDESYTPWLPMRAHRIENDSITPYYADFTTPMGDVIGPDSECTIREVYTNGWCKVNYPVSGGKRVGYLPVSEFLLGTPDEDFQETVAPYRINTYSRYELENKIGFIAATGIYQIAGIQDGVAQAIYPTANNDYRVGWYQADMLEKLELKLLQDYILGRTPITQEQLARLDLNGDGVANVFDLGLMKRKLLGMAESTE